MSELGGVKKGVRDGSVVSCGVSMPNKPTFVSQHESTLAQRVARHHHTYVHASASLGAARAVCRRWLPLATEDSLWGPIVHALWPVLSARYVGLVA